MLLHRLETKIFGIEANIPDEEEFNLNVRRRFAAELRRVSSKLHRCFKNMIGTLLDMPADVYAETIRGFPHFFRNAFPTQRKLLSPTLIEDYCKCIVDARNSIGQIEIECMDAAWNLKDILVIHNTQQKEYDTSRINLLNIDNIHYEYITTRNW